MLHAANAVSHGYQRILIIDIIALGISFLGDICADNLWVSFGIGKKLRNISIHNIGSTMSYTKAKALPAFHALTGSHNTYFFSGTGNKSATQNGARDHSPQRTTHCHLMDNPETPSSDDIGVIESSVISLYSISCTLADVNQSRQQIFAHSSRTFEYPPLTKAALVEHVKRTTHQAKYVWGQSIIAKQVLPSPSLFGQI